MVIARRELNRAAKRAESAGADDTRRHAPVEGTEGSAAPAKAVS
jgi:hypothetical protein